MRFGFGKKEQEEEQPQQRTYSTIELLVFEQYVDKFREGRGGVNTDKVLIDLGIAVQEDHYFSLFEDKLEQYREFWNKFEAFIKIKRHREYLQDIANLGIHEKERFTTKSIQEVAKDKNISGDREEVRD